MVDRFTSVNQRKWFGLGARFCLLCLGLACVVAAESANGIRLCMREGRWCPVQVALSRFAMALGMCLRTIFAVRRGNWCFPVMYPAVTSLKKVVGDG